MELEDIPKLTDRLIERMSIIRVLLSVQFLENLATVFELFDSPIVLDPLSLPMFLGRIGVR